MKTPIRIAVTGAAGQIGYNLLFRLASGALFGADQPIILQLLEVPPVMSALNGTVMELNDCAFPLLDGIEASDNPMLAFKDADCAFLIGAKPRGPGMERKDLLEANAAIFSSQGQALNAVAKRNVKILVTGNPANTNALITLNNAPDLAPENITAMTRLDHDRAHFQLAEQCQQHTTEIRRMIIWGNHSATQYPDLHHATVHGQAALTQVDESWFKNEFIPTVQQRGAAIIQARGLSSAASAANAAIAHMRDWYFGTADDDWVSMAVVSDGSYGIETGLVYSFPVTLNEGRYSIVQDLNINDFSLDKMQATELELKQEREAVKHLFK